MSRKLASIQTIIDVIPHNNADTLEIAKVLGWTCVVLKGQFQKGDHIVFIEPDAILPEGKEQWEFMRSRGFRIKTIKLRGVVSQGLVFSAHIILAEKYLPLCDQIGISPLPDGTDVTEALGITKYEPYVPAQLAGTVKGNFPEFLHKTDEERIQTCAQLLEKHKDKKFYVTEKLDGSSMTVFLKDGAFGVCSRNLELKETEGNSYWKVARELNIESKLMGEVNKLPLNISLQGELVGMGVQNNKYKLSGLEFRIFNVFDIDKQRYLCYNDFKDIAYGLGLTSVPVITEDYILPTTVEELIEFSKGKSILNKDVHREGVVFRPLVEEYEEELHGRLSFKAINPDFLIKYDSE